MRSKPPIRLLCLLAAACTGLLPAQEAPDDPLELGIEEEVDVQLVLVDLLVLDRRDRTVPDLVAEDFLLLVDGKLTQIESLDRDCVAGAMEDARPGPGTPPPQVATAQPRQIVIVFDYLHMTNVAETFDRVQESLDRRSTGDERHMIASLGEVVRLETPFTTDLDELRWAMRRMRNDRDLYAGNYGRLTESRFFERLAVLFDLLEMLPGRKTIVLLSGPFINDGFFHDPQYRELSGRATTTRTAIYPVDTGGLRTPGDPYGSSLGGPPSLRRLANETGGRMTSNTNDIGLAYAKAHRDLGCAYTLGFYDTRPRFDRDRRLTIRVQGRQGLRVVYPEFYTIRSREERRKSLARTAGMAPHMFESSSLALELFALGPESTRRWRALMGVEIRVAPEDVVEPGESWRLRGLVRKPNGTLVRSFERTVPLPEPWPPEGGNAVVTVFQKLSIPPGRYIVSAVLAGAEDDVPRARTRPAELAAMPRDTSFLIGPIVGRRTAVAPGPGLANEAPAFRPSLTRTVERGQPLDALTLFCVRSSEDRFDGSGTIAREISTTGGESALRFSDAALRLPGSGSVRCQEVLDGIPTEDLESGRYEITASAEIPGVPVERRTTEFSVRPPGGGPDR